MPETPAQRAAREANLRKGNPSAYRRREESETEPAPAPASEPEKTTFRARAPKRAKPKARRVPPRAPKDDPPPRKDPPAPKDDPPAKRGSSGGFFQGLAEGLGR